MSRALPRRFQVSCIAAALALSLAGLACAASASLEIPADQAAFKSPGKKLAAESRGEPAWLMDRSGEIGDYVNAPADATYPFVVRCCATPALGRWPVMNILVDNVPAASVAVDKESFADYTFPLKLSAGAHRIAIAFLNHEFGAPEPGATGFREDRTLIVSRYAIQGEAALATQKDWLAEMHKREEKLMAGLDQEIARVRKGPAVVRVVDAAGNPVAGAKVTAELERHAFLFGCNIYMFDRFRRPEENALYKQRFADLFNYATVGFYWQWYEPQRGRPDYPYTDKVVAWCEEHGIRMKGHPLLWALDAGIPPWSKGQPDAETQKARVTEIIRRYGAKIAAWEVVNEPAHQSGIPIDEPYRWARAADPKAYLIVNDYHVFADGYPPFFDLLRKAEADGVPFDGIGIQAHEPRTMRFPLASVKDILDRYATLGKDIHITEFTPTSSGQPVIGDSDGGVWDEKTQAEYAEKFYRVCFANPAVVAITWWDLCDHGAWLKNGGMLRSDLSPKPVYEALSRLINQEWHTRVEGRTDAAGRFAFSGFAGKYKISATIGEKTFVAESVVARGAANPSEIVVKLAGSQ